MSFVDINKLLNIIPVHIYWKNKNGEYLGCNLAQARSYGFNNPSELIGKTDFQLAPSEELARTWFANDQKVLQTGKPIVIEETGTMYGRQAIGMSYKSPFSDEAGNIIGIVGITIDITHEKEIQQQLINEKYNTQITLDNIITRLPAHVYWMDDKNRYLGCNDLQAKSAGLKNRHDIVGKTNHDMPWAEIADSVDAINMQVMNTGEENTEELETQLADGTKQVIFSKKAPMLDTSGHVIGLLGISFDITDRKRMEEALLIAKEQAEAANHAKTEFLASMSHDVKTPLSGVISVTELLASRAQNPEDKKLLEDLGRCGKKLMAFFENCIELSKMDMAELQKLDQAFSMQKIIEAIHELFIPSATAKKLRFSIHHDPALPELLIGNQTNIYRVILNLIGNAIKFTPEGSVDLSVKLHERVDDENIIVKIIVKDTGIGIPKDKQQVIFEKLQRLTPSYYSKQEGHGIGLYVVDQYVKSMQGTIDVDSDVGQGSCFTITLPLKIANDSVKEIVLPPKLTEKEVPAAAVIKPYVVTKITDCLEKDAPSVLLVEDNLMIQSVTKQIIYSANAHVDVASSGAEALNLFSPGKYTVIYMDIGLPDMEGYEVSQRIRAIEEEKNATPTPIIALSAHASDDIRQFCTDAKMQGVLSKPLSVDQARQILNSCLQHKPLIIEGLRVLSSLPVLDFAECVNLLGKEDRAKEILAMLITTLDNEYLPEIQKTYKNNDDESLRKVLHKFLGSVCYVSAPALKQATLDFQMAVKEKLPGREQAYREFLLAITQFQRAYACLPK